MFLFTNLYEIYCIKCVVALESLRISYLVTLLSVFLSKIFCLVLEIFFVHINVEIKTEIGFIA